MKCNSSKRKIITVSTAMAMAIGLNCHAQTYESTDTLRILALGNSFAQDAISYSSETRCSYFHDLLAAAGIPATIGVMAIGSCSLEMHVDNAKSDAAAYNFQVIDPDGTFSIYSNTRLSEALSKEKWTHVSLQQVSNYSGLYESYTPYLKTLIAYVKSYVPDCTLAWYQTWAYQADCDWSAFSLYGNNQMTMYQGIMNASQKVMSDYPFDIIMPVGTAIQNARSSYYGDNLTRDGAHLSYTIGRYIAASTWYEAITGLPIQDVDYTPADFSSKMLAMSQTSVSNATTCPYQITDPSSIDFNKNGITDISDDARYEICFDNLTGTATYNGPISVYNLQGQLVAHGSSIVNIPAPGLYIIHTPTSTCKLRW